jgi:hypothetical protein
VGFFKKRLYLEQINQKGNELNVDRNNIKIAIIDDMDIPYLDSLNRSGYNVRHYKDIEDFDMIKSYPIIICDIKGVGKKFASKFGGAYLIQEIRKLYPEKYIIAMSSAVYKVNIAKAVGMADDKIIRDSDVDRVIKALNKAINIMKSNKKRWLRLREELLNTHEMDLYDVWEIEQQFIKSYINKDKSIFENHNVTKHSSDIVKGLLVNFISGIIF